MYLGIDYLITPGLKPIVVEVNVGLPGGAQEYDLAHRVYCKRPSHIFHRVEETALYVYRKPFKDYLSSLPWIKGLKSFKLWMDSEGPFPTTTHPGLRLEDKWVQYQLLKSAVPMPKTIIYDPLDLAATARFLKKENKAVLKRRLGRGGRGFRLIMDSHSLSDAKQEDYPLLLQEYIDSTVNGYVFSIRAIAFGGRFLCMYANLSRRPYSNHGIITFVTPSNRFGLANDVFTTQSFNQKSWEAGLWFGEDEPAYLKHNLYEDEVAQTTLFLPAPLCDMMRELSVKIERLYEGLDLSSLPRACFEPLPPTP